MAVYEGISKVNGVAIGNIAKIGGRAKADVFNVSSTPRQSNLYRVLSNDGNWGSYTAGKNYASFVAVGQSGGSTVFFAYGSHSAGDTYNFTFTKTGTFGARIVELRVSEVDTLLSTTGGGSFDVGSSSGSVSTSITASSSNTTLYIGFRKVSTASTDTLDIGNFIVTKS